MMKERPQYRITTRIEELAKCDHEILGYHLNDTGICNILLRKLGLCKRDAFNIIRNRPKSVGERLLHVIVDKDRTRTIGMLKNTIIAITSESNNATTICDEIVSTLDNWIGTAKYNGKTRIEDLKKPDHTLLGELIDKYNIHADIASDFGLTERDSRNVHEYLHESQGERFLHIWVERDSSITIKHLTEILNSAYTAANPKEQKILNNTLQLLFDWICSGSDRAIQNLSVDQATSDIYALGGTGAEGSVPQNINRGNVMSSPSDSNLRHYHHRMSMEEENDKACKGKRQEQQTRFHKAVELQRKLGEVDVKQKELEERDFTVVHDLCLGILDAGKAEKEMKKWLNLIFKKNSLSRYESVLTVIEKYFALAERQIQLEKEHWFVIWRFGIKSLSDQVGSYNFYDLVETQEHVDKKHEIFEDLVLVVDERNKLFAMLKEYRLREQEKQTTSEL